MEEVDLPRPAFVCDTNRNTHLLAKNLLMCFYESLFFTHLLLSVFDGQSFVDESLCQGLALKNLPLPLNIAGPRPFPLAALKTQNLFIITFKQPTIMDLHLSKRLHG